MRTRRPHIHAAGILAAISAVALWRVSTRAAGDAPRNLVAITPNEIHWFTPSYYTDGRQRAQLVGDSSKSGPFVDRVKIPRGGRVRAHTHPDVEMDTVIEGTWYLGVGMQFDPATMKAYPAGSFLIIPPGVPHYVAARDGEVVVQISGQGPFKTDYVEK
jgi:quercetin dioxygenase-like cupin family protein